MRIFLIGYMGSGKTTLGNLLALTVKYKFIDLDKYIENKTNKSIAKIFEENGENYFRDIEKKYLHEACDTDNIIISTGGGTPCFFDNIDFMNKNGISIYLKVKPEVLITRLKNEKNKRPLIKDKSDEELLIFINEMLNKRELYYNKATYIINGETPNINSIINLLNIES